jgi:hypothetical protein
MRGASDNRAPHISKEEELESRRIEKERNWKIETELEKRTISYFLALSSNRRAAPHPIFVWRDGKSETCGRFRFLDLLSLCVLTPPASLPVPLGALL